MIIAITSDDNKILVITIIWMVKHGLIIANNGTLMDNGYKSTRHLWTGKLQHVKQNTKIWWLPEENCPAGVWTHQSGACKPWFIKKAMAHGTEKLASMIGVSYWLVVWNIICPFTWEWKIIRTDFHSIMFQRGLGWNHQPVISYARSKSPCFCLLAI